MLAIAAAFAIGSLFPFGKLVDSDGKVPTLAQFSGKTTIIYLRAQAPAESDAAAIRSLADVTNEERQILVAPVFRAAATPLVAFRKKYALPQLFSSDLSSSEVLLVNPKGRIVKSWTAPAESKIAGYVSDWLSGKSLSIGYEAIDPRPMLTPIPALQPAMTWMGLIGQAFRLRFPPPGNIARIKNEKGLLVLFLSSRSAGMEIYSERIKKVAEKCRSAGVSLLGLFSEYDETPEAVSNFIASAGFEFPCAADPGNALADAYRAMRIPETFLMDSKMRVSYTGAIDSSTFESGESTPFLQNAIQALAVGREPVIAKTLPFGTVLRRSAQDERASPFESLRRDASAFYR